MATLSDPALMNTTRTTEFYADEDSTRARGLWSSWKRTTDIMAALTIIVVVLPVMLILWIMSRFDGGPGFYGHSRVGLQGREFCCLKFRTMVVDADVVLSRVLEQDPSMRMEWELSRKFRHDPRVTPIGRFMRATSLDELPQLFNVVRGDMSLVGPRPVVRAELDAFYGTDARSAYLSVRPGVTGLWQVSGRSDLSYDRRVALDTTYARNVSFGLDAMILCRTLKVVFAREGAR